MYNDCIDSGLLRKQIAFIHRQLGDGGGGGGILIKLYIVSLRVLHHEARISQKSKLLSFTERTFCCSKHGELCRDYQIYYQCLVRTRCIFNTHSYTRIPILG